MGKRWAYMLLWKFWCCNGFSFCPWKLIYMGLSLLEEWHIAKRQKIGIFWCNFTEITQFCTACCEIFNIFVPKFFIESLVRSQKCAFMLDTVHRDAASLEHFVVSADFRQALLLPEQTSTVGRCRRCENIFVTLDRGYLVWFRFPVFTKLKDMYSCLLNALVVLGLTNGLPEIVKIGK